MITELILAAALSTFVGAVAGYIGSLMLTKRMALIVDPLGHLCLPGMSLAFAYGFDVSIGALLFLVIGTILIWFLNLKTNLPMEAVTAVVFSSSLSVAFLTMPSGKTAPALLGDLSQISATNASITIAISILIFIVTKLIYKKLLLISISSDLAKADGISTKFYNFVYLSCVSLIVALGVRIVGGLMTAALVAIPACTSKNLSTTLSQYMYISLVVGGLASLAGVLVSALTGLPPGPLIIIASSIVFVVSIFVRKTFSL
jgi:ABC-type Mn2+/Zn2+ transport system permease subunit